MKVRERILHIGLTPKVIHLKLFFDIVPSSSADILFSRCVDSIFVEDLFLSLRSFQSKEHLQRSGDVFFDILISSKGASALGMF